MCAASMFVLAAVVVYDSCIPCPFFIQNPLMTLFELYQVTRKKHTLKCTNTHTVITAAESDSRDASLPFLMLRVLQDVDTGRTAFSLTVKCSYNTK